jgi:lipoyl(octanoyl) transferase
MPEPPTLECRWADLGRMDYGAAFALQQRLVESRRRGEIPDWLLLLEHSHVITLGRNGKRENLLAGEEHLRRAGVEFYTTDRGGDVTYHGPGQLVGYAILDLRYWKRDVVAYLRALEQALLEALGQFGIVGQRVPGLTGVWVAEAQFPKTGELGGHPVLAKIAAIGVHIGRWITSHGFALNVATDLRYFQYIVPCGLAGKPVTSMERVLGRAPAREQVAEVVARSFGRAFSRNMTRMDPSALGDPLAAARSGPSAASGGVWDRRQDLASTVGR